MGEYKRILVTAALPYANGPLHIGHIAGCYLPADIYVRYMKLCGKDVLFVCGSDEHGVAITIQARKEGTTPRAIIDKYHKLNKHTFEEFGIAFDVYHRTSDLLHHHTAQEFFLHLYKKGELIEREVEQYFDPQEKLFLPDRYIVGKCPYCGYEQAYGDQCEACGNTLSPDELINPRSSLSDVKPVLKKSKHWFFPLDRYQKWLEEYVASHEKDWKPNVYGQCISWLKEGLKPRAITRDLDWGVPVPLSEAKGKVLYVWFEAPIGYISATKYWAQLQGKEDLWEAYWKDPETRLIHFIGKDNIVFHALIFPAMLRAHGDFVWADQVPANEFLNLEGKKLSTSRGWAVWLHEYLSEFRGQQDILRYVLCANMPETKDSDFTWDDFKKRNDEELVGVLSNFVYRTMKLIENKCGGVVPSPLSMHRYSDYFNEAKQSLKECFNSLESFRFRDGLKAYLNIARIGNRLLSETEPWKKSQQEVDEILFTSVQLIYLLGYVSQIFLPYTAEKIKDALKVAKWGAVGEIIEREFYLNSGKELEKPIMLFRKIEEKTIELQVQKLRNPNVKKESKKNGSEISLEDFQKIHLRIGTILRAERVPNTKKLLKLLVDVGESQPRTIVSGIAEYYKPDSLIGKQVVVVVNLQPKLLKGIESQGMILMVKDKEQGLLLLQPEKRVQEGSYVE